MRAIKLLKGLMQDAQYEKYQHQCSSEIASAIDECKKFRSIIEFGTNAIAKLIIETLK
ncbi:hypothetical protein IPH67_03830 [bacterium]|nr:MAG: hypothetical protein IPH67_03830 [bacterium]